MLAPTYDAGVTLVSVIVPVHNAERHLRECLASIQSQTLTDVELILVDDGSTDSTPQILEDFAASETRARVLQGPGLGSAGAARNLGLDVATGEYLTFLDADDFFLPTMLEELHAKADADRADVVACKFLIYNDATREVTQPDWMLRLERLPQEVPFAPGQVPDHLFDAFNPAAWNKLFRSDFIRQKELRFQSLRRTNDAYFTYMALALAQRITYIDRHLVNYRVENSTSLQATVHENPMEFVQALDAMRDTLKGAGLWEVHERAFVNLALNLCVGNLKRQRTASGFVEVYDALREGVFEHLGMLDRPDRYFLRAGLREWRERVLQQSASEYLFDRAQAAEADVARLSDEVHDAIRDAAMRVERPTRRLDLALAADRGSDPASHDTERADVSVVIPVYNTIMFLAECIESVQRQTGCSVEIICIDDGSEDGSGEVLDRYARSDPRVRVVHQENGGLSRARNAGLDVATGRYVCFLDSDDYWQGDSLAQLVRQADDDSLDVLLFDATSVREPEVDDELWERYATYYTRQAYDGSYDGPRLMAAMNREREYRASACLYLARRDLLRDQDLRFVPGITHEDNLFTFALLLNARRAGHSQIALYGRRVRPGSIMTAGSQASAARGYFITWVEMLRLLRGRTFSDVEVTSQVAEVAQAIFAAVRRSASPLPEEVVARLREVDEDADTAALFLVVQRSWKDERKRKKLETRLRSATAGKRASAFTPRGLARRAKRVVKRVLDSG